MAASSQNFTNDTDASPYIGYDTQGATAGLGIYRGKGRIELVTDAWHAISIIESLQAKELLKRALSPAEMQVFAERISEIKNTRNTDFRLEDITEQEALIQFLQSSEWAAIEDYRFYPTLLDAWAYEGFQQRFSGKEFKLGLVPNASVNGYRRIYRPDSLREESQLFMGLNLEFAYNNYKVISDAWQLNNLNSFRINGSVSERIPLGNSVSNSRLISIISTDWELQYLPSQRTHYGIRGSLLAFARTGVSVNMGLSGQFVHYFSPRFNLRIVGGVNIQGLERGAQPWAFGDLLITTSYRFY